MELETYRDNLEMLNEMYPGVAVLKLGEAARIFGMSDQGLARKIKRENIPSMEHNSLSKAVVARILSGKKF